MFIFSWHPNHRMNNLMVVDMQPSHVHHDDWRWSSWWTKHIRQTIPVVLFFFFFQLLFVFPPLREQKIVETKKTKIVWKNAPKILCACKILNPFKYKCIILLLNLLLVARITLLWLSMPATNGTCSENNFKSVSVPSAQFLNNLESKNAISHSMACISRMQLVVRDCFVVLHFYCCRLLRSCRQCHICFREISIHCECKVDTSFAKQVYAFSFVLNKVNPT